MKLTEFDYYLPAELIAQEPLAERDSSRLMILHKSTGEIEHRSFVDLIEYLTPKDIVVLNDSRVIRARLYGTKETGAKVEVLLLRDLGGGEWEALVKPGRKAPVGTRLDFGSGLTGEITGRTEHGGRTMRLKSPVPIERAIEQAGEVPLPPYIKRRIDDPERYQTVYARKPGSVAAPTAGLHFTQAMLRRLSAQGIKTVYITLHIGLGTFRPVQTENVEEHKMHEEYYEVSQEVADAIETARRQGGRVLAVGTTVARTLESCASKHGSVMPGSGWTSLFIYPGYQFKVVDMMLTNFHLPKSTLLMLVSALAGKENILNAYSEAVRHRYRFFSFGDAMLII